MENFLSFTKARISLLRNDGSVSKFSIITGPNGAGKSSVFQAIKFVLGSNAKDGRYAKWDGFIHHGAEFLRVKVGFRATDGTVYEIARLLRKDQGSDFYLNGNHVNATTVYALVKELRIYPDNIFSFVAQGHVNAIKDLSAKEIYSLIEAGMGIADLRSDIEVNAAKLEGMNTQMENLQIQKDTCSKQDKILVGKMEKLQEKRQLEAELVKFNAERSWAQKADIIKKIDEKKLAASEKEVQKPKMTADLDAHKNRLAEFSGTRDGCEKAIDEKKDCISGLKADIARLDEEATKWDKAKQDLKQKNDTLKAEKEQAAKDLESLDQQLRHERVERDSLDKVANDHAIKSKSLQEKLDRIRGELVKNKDWLEKHDSIKADLQQETKDKKNNQNNLDANETDIKNVIGDINEITNDLRQFKWTASMDSKADMKSQIDKEVADLDAEIKRKSELLTQKKRDEADLRKQVGYPGGQGDDERRSFKEVEQLKQEIQNRGLQNDMKGPIHEFMQFDPAHARAIEAQFKKNGLLGFVAFTKVNFNLLNSMRKKLKVAGTIYWPKNVQQQPFSKPRVKFQGAIDYLYNLVKVPDWLKSIVYHIARDTIVVESFSDALALIDADDRARCVTLDGIIVEGKEDTVESAPPYYGPLILTPQQGGDDASAMVMRLNILVKENTTLEAEIDALKTKRKEKETMRSEFEKVFIYIKQKEGLSQRKSQLLAKKDLIKQAIVKNEKAISDLSMELKHLESQKPKEFLTLTNELSDTKLKLDDIQGRIALVNKDLVEAGKKVTELEFKHSATETKYNAAVDAHEQLKNEIKQNAADLKVLEDKKDGIKQEIKETSEAMAVLEGQKKEILASIAEETASINAIDVQVKVLEMEKEKIQHDIDGLEREQAYIELNLKGQIKPEQLKTIEEYDLIIGKFNKRLSSVEFIYISDEIEKEFNENRRVLKDISTKMDELNNEISKVKGIGDELKKDYLSKMTQKVKELEQLVVNKFVDLNIPFRPVLGAGGDFQNPRIDVSVDFLNQTCLPLMAVSEGQKSIIALSLMLTLQDLNPGPICVFDEAHIYLDDSNKELISRLIRKTTEKIQLIMLVPTTSHGFVKAADKIIAVVRQGMKFSNGDTGGKEIHQLGPSRVIEVDEQEFTRLLDDTG